jgi:hypothetical protein
MSDKNQTDTEPRQEIKLEDLPVNDEHQDKVKGGPIQADWLPAM